jgi:hypothetical protein
MYFLYKNEYGTFKPVEIMTRAEVEKRITEGMNQFGV